MDVTSYLLGKNAGGGSTPNLQNKEITITQNTTTTVTPDAGYDGLSSVEVTTNVSGNSASNPIIDDSSQINTSANTSSVSTRVSTYVRYEQIKNYTFYNETPKKGFVFAFVRGDYELSNDLILLAETDWFVSSDNITQKLIVCWCNDVTSHTIGITLGYTGRCELWVLMVKDILTPTASNIILNTTIPSGTSTYTVSPPNKDCFYFTSSVYNVTTTNAENFDNKFGNIWLSTGGRLVFYASYDNTEKNIVIPNTSSASGIIGIQLERS